MNANDRFSAGILSAGDGWDRGERQRHGPVSDLQARSGERAFTLECEAIQNIAINGRSLFGFARSSRASSRQGPCGRSAHDAGGLPVNGQRPNSNNMTIDGVANIDTGDNGGNMATTNLDAVAEFKMLTSSYQAEYGRAVGAQVQVVTKSGTQDFHGLRLLVRPPVRLEREHLAQQPGGASPPVGNGS